MGENLANNQTYTVYVNGVTFDQEKKDFGNGIISNVYNLIKTFTSFSGGCYCLNNGIIENLNKLNQIANLKDGWDGECASSFDHSFIEKVRFILTNLDYLPEIFPTACSSIQLEFDRNDGGYLEMEISADEKVKVFTIDNRGKENTTEIKLIPDEINKVVDNFYG